VPLQAPPGAGQAEFLGPLALVYLGGIEVALAFRHEVVHPAKSAGILAAEAEAVHDGQGAAFENPDLLVGTVRDGLDGVGLDVAIA
jgi:hypothetical protein